MPNVSIEQSGCRACNLCVEICPTDVLEMNESDDVAKVIREDDCIGCTSCVYLCPSRCVEVTDFAEQRPFYRIEENAELISKFLQKRPAVMTLTEADYDEALQDISTRLMALATTTAETVGRGQKALGRQSGQLAAAHLPEMYEGTTIGETLERLKTRFRGCFDFEAAIEGEGAEITFDFGHCALRPVVQRAGVQLGEATLCQVFHEYWAGLVGAFAGRRYMAVLNNAAERCEMKLEART